MNTNDRVLKVTRHYENGMITLPELIEFLTEIDYLSTLKADPDPRIRVLYDA